MSYQQGYNQQQPHYGQPHHGGQPQYEQQQYGGQQQQYYPPPGGQPGQQQYQQQGYGQAPGPGGPAHTAQVPEASDSGNYRGTRYDIRHRNTNSTLNIHLNQGDVVKSKPGAMIHMDPSVTLQGKIKVSFKKLFTGSELAESTYTGPGSVSLAPTLMGDIVTLPIDAGSKWHVGKHAFVAWTANVVRETKSQGFTKTLFSGEDLFIYHFTGEGLLWLTSYGAIETKTLGQGEQHIVDNGHLVAWNCQYQIEKVGGGLMQTMKTGEGLVCRFTGPGTIYIQTRNLEEFENWIRSVVPSSS